MCAVEGAGVITMESSSLTESVPRMMPSNSAVRRSQSASLRVCATAQRPASAMGAYARVAANVVRALLVLVAEAKFKVAGGPAALHTRARSHHVRRATTALRAGALARSIRASSENAKLFRSSSFSQFATRRSTKLIWAHAR